MQCNMKLLTRQFSGPHVMSSILGPKISSASYSQMLLIDVFAIMRNTKSHTTEARWWTYSFFV